MEEPDTGPEALPPPQPLCRGEPPPQHVHFFKCWRSKFRHSAWLPNTVWLKFQRDDGLGGWRLCSTGPQTSRDAVKKHLISRAWMNIVNTLVTLLSLWNQSGTKLGATDLDLKSLFFILRSLLLFSPHSLSLFTFTMFRITSKQQKQNNTLPYFPLHTKSNKFNYKIIY